MRRRRYVTFFRHSLGYPNQDLARVLGVVRCGSGPISMRSQSTRACLHLASIRDGGNFLPKGIVSSIASCQIRG